MDITFAIGTTAALPTWTTSCLCVAFITVVITKASSRFAVNRQVNFTFTATDGKALVVVPAQPAFGRLDVAGWSDPDLARARDGGAPFDRDYAVSVLADASVFMRAAGAAARATKSLGDLPRNPEAAPSACRT